jgi:hypothetical protein
VKTPFFSGPGIEMEEQMRPNNQNDYIKDLLDLLTTPIYRARRQKRVPGPNGFTVIEEQTDDTGVGNQNETDNQSTVDEIILDCGHPARGNLGGRCHFCDSLVCKACVALCCCCGLATCPSDRVIADFDGGSKPYCRSCAEEVRASLRLRKAGKSILSFFIAPDGEK